MQRTTAGLALLGLVLLSLLIVGATSTLSAQQPEPDTANESAASDATITVAGDGEVTAEPDRATVHVEASATGANASEAADGVAADAARLRTALNDSDAVAEVRSTDYRVREQRDEPPEPPGPQDGEEEGADERTFVASQSFAIELEGTEDAGEVIDLALRNGASEVQGVSFTLSEERHDELRREAIDRAVADADDQASAIAESSDLELGDVQHVSSTERGFVPVAQADDAAAAGTEIDPNDVTVRASVEVTYGASEPSDGVL